MANIPAVAQAKSQRKRQQLSQRSHNRIQNIVRAGKQRIIKTSLSYYEIYHVLCQSQKRWQTSERSSQTCTPCQSKEQELETEESKWSFLIFQELVSKGQLRNTTKTMKLAKQKNPTNPMKAKKANKPKAKKPDKKTKSSNKKKAATPKTNQ